MSEQLLTGFTGPAVFVETWPCAKSAVQYGRHWPCGLIEVHSNEIQLKFQVLPVTTLQALNSPTLLMVILLGCSDTARFHHHKVFQGTAVLDVLSDLIFTITL